MLTLSYSRHIAQRLPLQRAEIVVGEGRQLRNKEQRELVSADESGLWVRKRGRAGIFVAMVLAVCATY